MTATQDTKWSYGKLIDLLDQPGTTTDDRTAINAILARSDSSDYGNKVYMTDAERIVINDCNRRNGDRL